mmetsp:Transcript_122417/g.391404  ORF Transcript_122417/g.391404 Transcript_122417/m.391404 type:complete len:208 (+) Transcript_122417:569-1192(+)
MMSNAAMQNAPTRSGGHAADAMQRATPTLPRIQDVAPLVTSATPSWPGRVKPSTMVAMPMPMPTTPTTGHTRLAREAAAGQATATMSLTKPVTWRPNSTDSTGPNRTTSAAATALAAIGTPKIVIPGKAGWILQLSVVCSNLACCNLDPLAEEPRSIFSGRPPQVPFRMTPGQERLLLRGGDRRFGTARAASNPYAAPHMMREYWKR